MKFALFAETGRKNVAEIVKRINACKAARKPLSLVRLGDGEGRLLGFPDFVTKRELDNSLHIRFGRTDFATQDLISLSMQLRQAVRAADIIGVPRIKQQQLRPPYENVIHAIRRQLLIRPDRWITDADVHRYFQFGLFFNDILHGERFCGLITARDIRHAVRETFAIQRVDQYLLPGESHFPGASARPNYPDAFFTIKDTLTVPFKGAIFLVGAGALGKIYCHWIQQKGGIAIDVGSVFDGWVQQVTRKYLREADMELCEDDVYSLSLYKELSLSFEDACRRYNRLCDISKLDTARI